MIIVPTIKRYFKRSKYRITNGIGLLSWICHCFGHRFVLLVIGSIFLLLCCKQYDMPEWSVQNEFHLSLSRGGGFTGATRGCDFFSDGRVRQWKKRAGGIADSLQVLVLDPSVLCQQVDELSLLELVDIPGNMWYRVSLLQSGEQRIWMWREHIELTSWYRTTWALCQ